MGSAADSRDVSPAGERARVAGKTSLTRLSIAEAAETLGLEVGVLRRRIRENSIPYERDEHGRVYVLVGAYSNLPEADRSLHREPQDEVMIRDLESQAADLRTVPVPPEDFEAPPAPPEVPEDSF